VTPAVTIDAAMTTRPINSATRAAAVLAAAWFVCGCSSTLETGYVPRPLGGSSSEVRRGYYAQPFTPEAKKAKDYEQDFGGAPSGARPRPGGY